MGSRKGPLLFWSDIGLAGTFHSFIEETAEEGFVKIKFVPFGIMSKPTIHPRAIRKEHIKRLAPTRRETGIEEDIIFIYTAEDGSLMKSIVDDENIKLIRKLQDEIRGYKKQLASTKQEASTAQSGVSKSVERLKSINRSQRTDFPTPFGGGGGGGGYVPEERNVPGFGEDDGSGY